MKHTETPGYSSFSKLFPLSDIEGQLLAQKEIYTVSQIMELDYLAGMLTTDKNNALLADLTPFPFLQHKLSLLICALRRNPTADKMVCLVTMGYALFQLNKNIIYRKQLRNKLHKSIQTPPSYGTRQRDGITLLRREIFLNLYKVPSLSMLPSKTKESTFQILNRTIWTRNKAF
jgi:hypothetical protein